MSTMPALSVVPGRQATTWHQAVGQYLTEGLATGLSTRTYDARKYWLLGPHLTAVRAELGLGEVLDLRRELLVALLAGLRRGGAAPATVRTAATIVRAFARWCADVGLVAAGAAEALLRVARPRVPKGLVEPLSDAQVDQLLAACLCWRDRMLISFLLGTGLRISECLAITLDDLVERSGAMVVRVRRGKGGKDRYTPLGLPGRPLWPELRAYIEAGRWPAPPSERHLWLTRDAGDRPGPSARRRPDIDVWRLRRGMTQRELASVVGRQASIVARWEGGREIPTPDHAAQIASALGVTVADLGIVFQPATPLTHSAVWRLMGALGRATGIPVHPHLFRHTWATRIASAGVSLEALRVAGGWADLGIVQRYLHVGLGDVLDAWERAGAPQVR